MFEELIQKMEQSQAPKPASPKTEEPMKQNLRTILQRIGKDLRQMRTAICILAVYFILTGIFCRCSCPSAILFGLPCPGCGLTRAGLLLLTGHLGDALSDNPAILLWLPFLSYLLFFRYLLGKKIPALLPLLILVCSVTLLLFGIRLVQHTLPPVAYPGVFTLVKRLLM